ncbi:putative oxidoreductase [Mycobacteroides abscessus subsp. abscessus]|nr:Putative oxidoreductase [Mycobacteroides abscessus subsp. abscessus]SHW97742.1 putative oxidoreductase [Mycobacteroides abscessus subsp. abscessus]SHX56702.1 putative oxidoreductase [Mycobacteroides abscessus subsp. abscessus]SIB72560.1 putative oxidoreductase [Mycobacteroides abscessus subsp. abscessus]SIC05316.1 putative oxidoreductase [Mycobacteroides abscessus subsp. abscessus]
MLGAIVRHVVGRPRIPQDVCMRAAYIQQRGPAENIRYGTLSEPVAQPGEVIVQVDAVAVNPVDTFVRSGSYPTEIPLPFVVGRDLVGRVVHGAAGFQAGEKVWCGSLGYDGRQGATAELVAVPAERLYRLPVQVDPLAAVAVLHPASTAYLATIEYGEVRSGETVLILGAGGNVGSAAVALAVGSGAMVIAVASRRSLDRCAQLGAHEVYDYTADWVPQVSKAHHGAIDVCIDTSGVNDVAMAVDLLAPHGRIVLLSGDGTPETQRAVPLGPLYRKSGSLRGFVMSRATVRQLTDAAQRIAMLLGTGEITPNIIDLMHFSETARAHRRIETEVMGGTRLVLLPA